MVNQTKNLKCENCESQSKGVFCDLEKMALHNVSQQKVTNFYKKGQIIFYQGNPPFGLYCISQGKIKITKTDPDGKVSIVRLAGSGDVLGHRSLFSNENYSATATAMEDTIVCFLDKMYIHEAIQDQPSIALNIIQQLSREVGAAEQRNASMFQKDVRERMAELFLILQKNYGIKEEGRTKIDIKLTREELASMIGTASETVIRFISEFKKEGLIEQEGKIIYVVDEEKLLKFANLS